MAKRYKNPEKLPETGMFGFAWDSLKVIFKPWPDEDQSFFEFLMEKLGALALFLVSMALIIGFFVAIFFEVIF
ncbi:MAG: hypothetical protein ACOYXC_21685 [Candidatus Rifleibacteriota bacterium]